MLEVVKTKELKSTTRVDGILVQMSNGEWYGVTRVMPQRNPWYLRGAKSSRTGRIEMTDIFMKRCTGKPELKEGIDMLVRVLNGEDPILDRPAY